MVIHNRRPNYQFAKEWLNPEVATIIKFAANCSMSYAQIDRIIRETMEEMEVEIVEGH